MIFHSSGRHGVTCSRSPWRFEAQQRFDDQPVQPARRSGVPGPAAAARVRRNRVDIRGDDIRLGLVGGDRFLGLRMVERVDQRQQLPGTAAVAQRGERHRRPHGGVRVLAAVLAHAGDIALDVARIHTPTRRTAGRATGPGRDRDAPGARSTASIAFRERSRRRPHPRAPTSSGQSNRSAHSGLPDEPSGEPSSNQARRYQSPSQACWSMFRRKSSASLSQRSARPASSRRRATPGTGSGRRAGRIPATRFLPCRECRRGSCRRSSRRIPSGAGRARRIAGRDGSRARNARTGSRFRRTARAGRSTTPHRHRACGPRGSARSRQVHFRRRSPST